MKYNYSKFWSYTHCSKSFFICFLKIYKTVLRQIIQKYFDGAYTHYKLVFHIRNLISEISQRQEGEFLTLVKTETGIFGPRQGTSQEESAETYALNLG